MYEIDLQYSQHTDSKELILRIIYERISSNKIHLKLFFQRSLKLYFCYCNKHYALTNYLISNHGEKADYFVAIKSETFSKFDIYIDFVQIVLVVR